jgi:multiple sugar transport system substrate-binding protein
MGEPPVIAALYDDPALQQQVPYLATLKTALESAVARPQAVSYSEFSQIISTEIYAAIQAKADPAQTLTALQSSLQALIDQSN